MNEFWEIHKKILVFLGILIVVSLIAWFAVGNTLYASMVKSKGSAKSNYQELKKIYSAGSPIDTARKSLQKLINSEGKELEVIKESMKMRFHEYINIPKDKQKTKQSYLVSKLYDVRDDLIRRSSMRGQNIPENIGWPADIGAINTGDRDSNVEELLKKLSVTDKVLSLLLASSIGSKSKISEITSVELGESYVGRVKENHPDLVRMYPISVTFVGKMSSINRFFDRIHYRRLDGMDAKVLKKYQDQFFHVEFLNVTWAGDEPEDTLKVQIKLNALEFIQQDPNTVREKTEKSQPGKPLGY